MLDLPEKLGQFVLASQAERLADDGESEIEVTYKTSLGEVARLKFKMGREAMERFKLTLRAKVTERLQKTIDAIVAAREIQPCDPCPENPARKPKTQQGASYEQGTDRA